MIIYDAEFLQDIRRRLDERRHQVALECVAHGVYKDTYEAKQGVRGKNIVYWINFNIDKMISDSKYKYKHLLYK